MALQRDLCTAGMRFISPQVSWQSCCAYPEVLCLLCLLGHAEKPPEHVSLLCLLCWLLWLLCWLLWLLCWLDVHAVHAVCMH